MYTIETMKDYKELLDFVQAHGSFLKNEIYPLFCEDNVPMAIAKLIQRVPEDMQKFNRVYGSHFTNEQFVYNHYTQMINNKLPMHSSGSSWTSLTDIDMIQAMFDNIFGNDEDADELWIDIEEVWYSFFE